MERLLALLADGRFHSGQETADSLGISRTAVWKQIQKLKELGLEVEVVRGRGYRLKRPLCLLDAGEIRKRQRKEVPHLEVLTVIDSTNRDLLDRADRLPKGSAALAEYQSAGRGRFGRRWVSPFGSNLYLSLLWRFWGIERTAGLSLAVGVAAVQALERLGIEDLGIKWPNDLVFEGRKLGGILIEARGEAHGTATVVIGIGINVSMPERAAEVIDQPWIDLKRATGRDFDRNLLAASVLDGLLEALEQFEGHGFPAFRDAYRRRCTVLGKPVWVIQGERRHRARALDVDEMGELVVEVEGGEVRKLSGGEVSLRII